MTSGTRASIELRCALQVATELVAHGRQEPIGEIGVATRTESLIESRAQDMCRHALINRGCDGPATFA